MMPAVTATATKALPMATSIATRLAFADVADPRCRFTPDRLRPTSVTPDDTPSRRDADALPRTIRPVAGIVCVEAMDSAVDSATASNRVVASSVDAAVSPSAPSAPSAPSVAWNGTAFCSFSDDALSTFW